MSTDTMTRTQKGRIAPPPRLTGTLQTTADAVAALSGVVAQAHWQIGSQTDVNDVDFYMGEEELGHIHLDGESHIPLGGAVVDALVKAGLARRFRWSRAFAEIDAADVDATLWLFSLRHAQISGATADDIRTRVAQRR
jgi:hypothetical protein